MAPKESAIPPLHIPKEPTLITPSNAEKILSAFLARTPNTPHLNPDAMLTTTGIQFSAHSGPTGGLTIHHLQRVAAALRGENLAMETREELEAMFGDEVATADLPEFMDEGDDSRLDASIGRREKSRERVREWHDGVEKNFLNDEYQAGGYIDFDAEGEDMEAWQKSRGILEGELGERDGAPVQKQNKTVPTIQTHDERGRIKREADDGDAGTSGPMRIRREAEDEDDGAGGAVDKAARKAAKKQRRLAEKKERFG